MVSTFYLIRNMWLEKITNGRYMLRYNLKSWYVYSIVDYMIILEKVNPLPWGFFFEFCLYSFDRVN